MLQKNLISIDRWFLAVQRVDFPVSAVRQPVNVQEGIKYEARPGIAFNASLWIPMRTIKITLGKSALRNEADIRNSTCMVCTVS